MYRGLLILPLLAAGAAPAWADVVSPSTKVSASAEAAIADVSGSADNLGGKGTVAVAPTQAEAEAAFQAARRSFMAVASGSHPDQKAGDIDQTVSGADDTVTGGNGENVALEDIKIVMDLENVTLRDVMLEIAKQAAVYTGPWTVKWRLKPENMSLLDEHVNLTVEAPFGQFCQLLTERVKNMTGTQLFVTAFAGARILLITDTYY